ncbi:MAG: hypothetical protein PWQ82_1268 [Thermosediminibacterales bacterium]|nr:hypothetical protein [Thermosediminibacterales bacterium]
MKIKWFGHACFGLTSQDGIRLVTDPFDGSIGYEVPRTEADIVTVSHDHYDHNYVEALVGEPVVVKTTEKRSIKGIQIYGVETFHDKERGEKRGGNIVFVFEIDGIQVCHLGDLGHVLTKEQVSKIGPVDILMIPVGGTFTINACEALEVVSQLKPKLIIPMHFKTPDVNLPIDGVEKFLEKSMGGEKLEKNFIEITADELTDEPKTIVLDYK